MVDFEVYTGQWSTINDVTEGTVDASGTARVVTGSESDHNYVFFATVIPVSAVKVGLIVNHTLDENYNESYLVFMLHLDTSPTTVTLEAVTRDSYGNETSRQTLASRNISLTANTPYVARVETETLSDGNFAVYCFIDDFMLVEAEDLLAQYSAGQKGFEILGNNGDSAQFLILTSVTAANLTVPEGGGSVGLPVCIVSLGLSVAVPQEDVVSLKLHLGCTKEVSSFDLLLQNWDRKYSLNGAYPILVGLTGGIGLCRAPNDPATVPVISLRVEGVEYQENPNAPGVSGEFYVHVTGRCWGEQLFRKLATIEYLNQKGEAIVKDLIDNFTSLSHTRNSVELVEDTSTTYIDLKYSNKQVFDILKDIADSSDQSGVIGFDFRVAPDGKFEFFLKNSKSNSVDLSESIEQSNYSKDISRVRNKITVYGAATKSTPLDKDAWTEILSPPAGNWTAFGDGVTVAQDSTVKAIGTSSIKCHIVNNAYGAIIFTFNAGYEVNANLYPKLALFTLIPTFSREGAITLFDINGKQMTQDQAFTGKTAWGSKSVDVGEANAANWVPGIEQSGFDWTQIKKVEISCLVNEGMTSGSGDYWIDGLYFGGMKYSAVEEDNASQVAYALREYVETEASLASDNECDLRAKALLAYYKDPAISLTIISTVIDYGTTPILGGDKVHVTLPNENVDDDFRVDYVEYQVDTKSEPQMLKITVNLGKEKPQLADYLCGLTSVKGAFSLASV